MMMDDRPTKRRATQACRSCRSRKVRCDLMGAGGPCTNCRLDGLECMLAENKRRRYVFHCPAIQSGLECSHLYCDSFQRVLRPPPQLQSRVRDAGVEESTSTVSNHMSHKGVAGDSVFPEGGRSSVDCQGSGTRASCPADKTNIRSRDGLSGHSNGTIPETISATINDLPDYVQPLSDGLDEDDLTYLLKKGVLSLPKEDFRNVCLCRYVEFVHPVLPLLELNETLTIIGTSNGQNGKISLLLLNVIIYAALPFVESKHIRSAGYASKLAARTVFYKKSKVIPVLHLQLNMQVRLT